MKILSLQGKRYYRRFRNPLRTSRLTIDNRTGWILRVDGADGMTGFGEAPDTIGETGSNKSGVVEADGMAISLFEAYLQNIEAPQSFDDLKNIFDEYPGYIGPSIRFGLETALADWAARWSRMSLSQWLNPAAGRSVPVNYLLTRPADDWEKIRDTIAGSGYMVVKVKVGGGSIEDDIALVRLIRETFGEEMAIRLDANRKWPYETALEALRRFQSFGIEYVEEPLMRFDAGDYRRLHEETGIPLALDESFPEIENMEEIMADEICQVVIVKPAVIGGMIRTKQLFALAARYGRQAIITSNLETEIGISSLLHLAASLDLQDPICGLDSLRMFENADEALTNVKGGRISLPEGNGIGIGERIWNTL